MVVAVHRALCQRLCNGDRERRVLEPRDRDEFFKANIRERIEYGVHLHMAAARVSAKVVKRREMFWRREDKCGLAVRDTKHECSLHHVDMMKATAYRCVVTGGSVFGGRVPELRVGPKLMVQHIVENRVHDSSKSHVGARTRQFSRIKRFELFFDDRLCTSTGQDQPRLNDALDRFVLMALTGNLPITLVNHPAAPHAFDLLDASETSREIIRRILAFLQFHLRA